MFPSRQRLYSSLFGTAVINCIKASDKISVSQHTTKKIPPDPPPPKPLSICSPKAVSFAGFTAERAGNRASDLPERGRALIAPRLCPLFILLQAELTPNGAHGWFAFAVVATPSTSRTRLLHVTRRCVIAFYFQKAFAFKADDKFISYFILFCELSVLPGVP